MGHSFEHALSSAKKYGGEPEDYIDIHEWFDESKSHWPLFTHRALRHHSEGIWLCQQVFGKTIVNSDGKEVPVRYIGEQHVIEDVGRIPTVADWLQHIEVQPWMRRVGRPGISKLTRDNIKE